jgi:hypothetical protein
MELELIVALGLKDKRKQQENVLLLDVSLLEVNQTAIGKKPQETPKTSEDTVVHSL